MRKLAEAETKAAIEPGSAAPQDVARAHDADAGIGTLRTLAGEACRDRGGGTSGAIWGRMLSSVGGILGGRDGIDADRALSAARHFREAVSKFGGAQVGDKALIDALVPFVETFSASAAQGDVVGAWREAAAAAQGAAEKTVGPPPRLGCARLHGDKAIGTPDPGAISLALIASTVLRVLEG